MLVREKQKTERKEGRRNKSFKQERVKERERGKEGWSKARRKRWKIKLVHVPTFFCLFCLSSNSESSSFVVL